jgi:hypothetical protein
MPKRSAQQRDVHHTITFLGYLPLPSALEDEHHLGRSPPRLHSQTVVGRRCYRRRSSKRTYTIITYVTTTHYEVDRTDTYDTHHPSVHHRDDDLRSPVEFFRATQPLDIYHYYYLKFTRGVRRPEPRRATPYLLAPPGILHPLFLHEHDVFFKTFWQHLSHITFIVSLSAS